MSWLTIYFKGFSFIAKGKHTVIPDLIEVNITRISPYIFRCALDKGDQLAKDIMKDTATYLAIGIVNMVNLFIPEIPFG